MRSGNRGLRRAHLLAGVLAIVTLVAPLPAASQPSTTLPPAEEAAVAGRVTAVGGDVVPNAAVAVRRSPSGAESFGAFVSFLFTAGIGCVVASEVCNPESGVIARTTSAGDGSFRLPLGREYYPGAEGDTDFYVTASLPPGPGETTGPATTEEFEVAEAVQRSPDLLLWTPAPVVEADPSQISVRWSVLPVERFDERDVTYRLQFVTPDAFPVHTLELAAGAATGTTIVDARLLEDARTAVALAGLGDVTVGPTIYHQTIEAPRVELLGPAGAPPSRGRPCTATRVDGAPEPLAGCPVTDGDLRRALRPVDPMSCVPPGAVPFPTIPPGFGFEAAPPLPPCPPDLREAVVDLGGPTDIGLIVVRGCSACAVDTSGDGASYTPFATSSGVVHVAPRPTSARFVRVRSANGGGVSLTAEVSVWPPRATDQRVDAAGTLQRPPGDDSESSPSDSALPALVALALILSLLWWLARHRVSEPAARRTWPLR